MMQALLSCRAGGNILQITSLCSYPALFDGLATRIKKIDEMNDLLLHRQDEVGRKRQGRWLGLETFRARGRYPQGAPPRRAGALLAKHG